MSRFIQKYYLHNPPNVGLIFRKTFSLFRRASCCVKVKYLKKPLFPQLPTPGQQNPRAPIRFFARTCSPKCHRTLLILLLVFFDPRHHGYSVALLQSNLQTHSDIHQFHPHERICFTLPGILRLVSAMDGCSGKISPIRSILVLENVGRWAKQTRCVAFYLLVTIKCRPYRLQQEAPWNLWRV